jgi:hypothetical protein
MKKLAKGLLESNKIRNYNMTEISESHNQSIIGGNPFTMGSQISNATGEVCLGSQSTVKVTLGAVSTIGSSTGAGNSFMA